MRFDYHQEIISWPKTCLKIGTWFIRGNRKGSEMKKFSMFCNLLQELNCRKKCHGLLPFNQFLQIGQEQAGGGDDFKKKDL